MQVSDNMKINWDKLLIEYNRSQFKMKILKEFQEKTNWVLIKDGKFNSEIKILFLNKLFKLSTEKFKIEKEIFLKVAVEKFHSFNKN